MAVGKTDPLVLVGGFAMLAVLTLNWGHGPFVKVGNKLIISRNLNLTFKRTSSSSINSTATTCITELQNEMSLCTKKAGYNVRPDFASYHLRELILSHTHC